MQVGAQDEIVVLGCKSAKFEKFRFICSVKAFCQRLDSHNTWTEDSRLSRLS